MSILSFEIHLIASGMQPNILKTLFRGSSQAQAAIDGQDLAGNELWCGREEQNRCGNFFSFTVALHRGLFGHATHKSGGRLLSEIDHAWGDRVYCDLWSQGFGHHFCEHVQGGF